MIYSKRLFEIAMVGILLFIIVLVSGQNQILSDDRVSAGPQFVDTLFNSPVTTPTPRPSLSLQAEIALKYIASRKSVPLDNLTVINEYLRRFPLLDRQFMAFKIFDREKRQTYSLLVDMSDNRVVEDVAAIERADAEAHRAKYGKLHPTLYERLQTVQETEALPIAIWVGGERGRDRETLYAILAGRYPEVAEALARHSSPFDVTDLALSRQIRAEYEQLRQEGITTRAEPLVTYLTEQKVAVEIPILLPSIVTTLTKQTILDLAERDDVGTLYLVEGEGEPTLNTGVPTNRVGSVWSDGVDGSSGGGSNGNDPVTIAILENGNVDRNNSYLNHASTWLVAPARVQGHATRVASAAASSHGTYRGMADGTTILSAGNQGNIPNVHGTLNWALDRGNVYSSQ